MRRVKLILFIGYQMALKEANEVEYWLDLLKETDYLSEIEYISIQENIKELLKLLVSIIKTSKAK